jgi:hypothetical protein
MAARPLAPLFALLALTGCEATTTVVTAIQLPAKLASGPVGSQASITRLHVAVCGSTSFSTPLQTVDGRCPTYASKQCTAMRDEPDLTTFSVTQTRIPSVPEFCASAWFDTNANGVIDSGDAVGQFEHPYPSQPSRIFSSNRYESPPIVLDVVP